MDPVPNYCFTSCCVALIVLVASYVSVRADGPRDATRPNPGKTLVQDGEKDEFETTVVEWRKVWTRIARLDVTDLANLTDKWPVSESFVDQLELHFAEYLVVENQILIERSERLAKSNTKEWDGQGVPKPEDWIAEVRGSNTYKTWCVDNKVDEGAWIRQLVRLRGMLGAKGLRAKFDVATIQKAINELLTTPDLGIPASTVKAIVQEYEVRKVISADVLKVLDDHEPKWTKDELRLHARYGSELESFLRSPNTNPFHKKDVDRRLDEEARKKTAEDKDTGEKGSDKPSTSGPEGEKRQK